MAFTPIRHVFNAEDHWDLRIVGGLDAYVGSAKQFQCCGQAPPIWQTSEMETKKMLGKIWYHLITNVFSMQYLIHILVIHMIWFISDILLQQ